MNNSQTTTDKQEPRILVFFSEGGERIVLKRGAAELTIAQRKTTVSSLIVLVEILQDCKQNLQICVPLNKE